MSAAWNPEPPSSRSAAPKGVRTESKAIEPTTVTAISDHPVPSDAFAKREQAYATPLVDRSTLVRMLLLVAIFIAVPLLELYVIIQVGQLIGALPTIAILLLDSILGAVLLRAQGRAA